MNRVYFNFAVVFIIGALVYSFVGFDFIGNVVYEEPSGGGIPQDEIDCMYACIAGEGCTIGDVECAETTDCQAECNAYQPTDISEDEQCVQDCLDTKDCEIWDSECQNGYISECDVECGMAGDAPDWDTLSEEEQCITVCVAAIDPELICGASSEGETGNEVCQQCAAECVYLYEGPCLNDEEITAKEGECETCDHCYGSPVMGESGEGYECIVDIECLDASGEFGDDAGSGPGIGDEEPENVFTGIVNFFKGLFS